MEHEIKKMNIKISTLVFLILSPLIVVLWLGAFTLRYDICSAKVNKSLTREEQQKFFPATQVEINMEPDVFKESNQISGFYRGVLKCYRDAKNHYYLWY